MGLRQWLRRRSRPHTAEVVRLVAAPQAIARYHEHGSTQGAAIDGALRQLQGLSAEVDDDTRWARLIRLARDIGDPWNADDWPLGFDGLLCAIPLCTHVSFECARCPVGQRQGERSCAHPTTAIGKLGDFVRRGDRAGLRTHIAAITAMLHDIRSTL